MEITPRQGEGLRVPMDFYLRLRRDTDGADFWGSDCQEYLTEKLAPFLPRMEYDPMDNTVTASLFQGADGKSREEMLCRSEGLDRLSGIPKKTYKALKKKVDELLREVDAEGADPEMKSMVEAFALPDPQKSPELYRVYGKGKLAILWGLERNADESIPLREIVRRDDCHSPGQWKKWLCVLLLVVAFGVGAFLYHCIACGGGGRDASSGRQIAGDPNNGGNGTPGTGEKDPRGPDVPSKPKQVEPESGGSTVSGPVGPRTTQTTPATSSGGDEGNTGEDGEGTQSSTAVSPSAPRTEGGTEEASGVKESEGKTPAIDTGSGAPNVSVSEEGTSPQPGGGDGTATGTEGNSGTTPDGTAEQGVPTEPSNGDKENTGEDGEGTQSPTVDSTSAPRTAEGTEETPGVKESEGKTPAVDNVSDTPTVPVLTEGTSPQPEGGDGTATGTEGNSGTTPDGTAGQGVRVDPMQKNAQVENPGRVIDFRVKVLPKKDVAQGKVRVSVQVFVNDSADNTAEKEIDALRIFLREFEIEGSDNAAGSSLSWAHRTPPFENDDADNAIVSGKIKGVSLDANHCVEVEVKEEGEELPYAIKLRNSKYPVRGGCKITIGTTK